MDFVWLAATTVFIDLSADAMRTVEENPPSMPNRDYSMIVTQSSGMPAMHARERARHLAALGSNYCTVLLHNTVQEVKSIHGCSRLVDSIHGAPRDPDFVPYSSLGLTVPYYSLGLTVVQYSRVRYGIR